MTGRDTYIVHLLGAAARELRADWEAAMADGDFTRSARLADVAQSVHRALVAFDDVTIG